jgi:macrolide transport system ATP-binding/permease protein
MGLLDWILRRRRDEDLQAEIRAHLTMATRDRIAGGDDPEGARLAALKEFGNVTLTREATRRSWGGGWRERLLDLAQDVRYSIRVLGRSPGYSLVIIGVLALGIGANVSVFGLFKAVGLEPLPAVKGSAGLGVMVARTGSGRIIPLSHADFRDLRKEQRTFDSLAGVMMDSFSLGLGTRGERVFGELVTGNYFSVLGVRASLGRTLQEADDLTPGEHPVVVISDGLWRRAFASDPAIVGKTVQINANPFTVVGVAEPGFQGSVVGVRLDLFLPLMMQPQLRGVDLLATRQAPMMWGLGHLRSGTSIRAASEEATSISTRLDAQQPAREVEQHATVIPMWRSPFGAQTYMLPAIMLMGVMGALLLLIVCANVSNLVLVRGISRRGEIAARLALGASRGRIMRLLFVESAVLSLPAAVCGLLTARGISALLNDRSANASAQVPISLNASQDWLVVAFAVLLSCGASLIFGFVPALRTSNVDLAGVMKDDLSPRGGSRGRLRNVLVAAQVAVSLLLLVGAGLVMRSLEAARTANVGFDERQVAIALTELTSSGYDEDRGRIFYERVLDTLRAQPGTESAALASGLPLTLVDNVTSATVIEGRTAAKGEDMRFLVNTVSPDYLRTLRIPLIAGRDFTRNDSDTSLRVAMINETMARRFWGSPDAALGTRIRVGRGQWRTVVGVARDIKYARVNEEPRPHVYLPVGQDYWSAMAIHVRSRDPEPVLLARLRSTIQTLDPNVPILRATMLRDQTRAALSIFTMAAGSLMTFGIIAMILTALGTYGLVSYTARQSTHEIGIRIAIGADRLDLLRRFLGRGVKLGAAGAVCGFVLSLVIARLLSSLLYGVSPTDLVSFTAALTLVMTIVLLASLVPAWRASRTDPIAALRHR